MINNRQSFRLRKQFDLIWSIPDQKIKGEAIIFNISLTGMLFVTDRLFKPEHGLTMYFSLEKAPSFPPKGKLVWFKKAGKGEAQYQCGVRFFNETIQSPAWIQWMEENISKLANIQDNKVLERYLSEDQQ